jgi:hypothetical protein
MAEGNFTLAAEILGRIWKRLVAVTDTLSVHACNATLHIAYH